eukprot:1258758-Prymnesium_polylepis.2
MRTPTLVSRRLVLERLHRGIPPILTLCEKLAAACRVLQAIFVTNTIGAEARGDSRILGGGSLSQF